jgi:uncharacterized surface protein with fasciclin (FAS1) repeats
MVFYMTCSNLKFKLHVNEIYLVGSLCTVGKKSFTQLSVKCKNSSVIVCDKVCQWLMAGQCFFPSTLVSSTSKTARHDTTEILLKMALNTITLNSLTSTCSNLKFKLHVNEIYLVGSLCTVGKKSFTQLSVKCKNSSVIVLDKVWLSRLKLNLPTLTNEKLLWSWSYCSWIYNYLCNQYLSSLTWVRILLMARCTRYNVMW